MARPLYTVAALLLLAAPAVQAQQEVVVASLSGRAWDSLRGRPLANATVLVAGLERRFMTDSQGRFEIADPPAGELLVQLRHPALDSIGIPGLVRRLAPAVDGRVDLALPSFATMWRAICDGEAPRDSGFVYGTVNNAVDRAPVPDADVELSWIETTADLDEGVRQKRHRAETRTNASGQFVICHIPMPQYFRLRASTADGFLGAVDIPPNDLRVGRRDLLLGPAATDSTTLGGIEGRVIDEAGYGYSEARVILDDSIETRTDGNGVFRFTGVAPGTRRVQVLSLGMLPLITTVDVYPGEPVRMEREMRRVTTLDVVRVIGTSRGQRLAEELEHRRLTGFGYTMGEVELKAHPTLETVFKSMPGARVSQSNGDFVVRVLGPNGTDCVASVWVDGARMAVSALNIIRPDEVLAIEFFPRASTVPMQFRGLDEQVTRCGAIAIWTRWAFGKR